MPGPAPQARGWRRKGSPSVKLTATSPGKFSRRMAAEWPAGWDQAGDAGSPPASGEPCVARARPGGLAVPRRTPRAVPDREPRAVRAGSLIWVGMGAGPCACCSERPACRARRATVLPQAAGRGSGRRGRGGSTTRPCFPESEALVASILERKSIRVSRCPKSLARAGRPSTGLGAGATSGDRDTPAVDTSGLGPGTGCPRRPASSSQAPASWPLPARCSSGALFALCRA